MNTEKERKTPKPLIPMAAHLTKLEWYAGTAPEVPDWFRIKEKMTINEYLEYLENNKIPERTTLHSNEEIFFQWRKYYAEQMVNLFK